MKLHEIVPTQTHIKSRKNTWNEREFLCKNEVQSSVRTQSIK